MYNLPLCSMTRIYSGIFSPGHQHLFVRNERKTHIYKRVKLNHKRNVPHSTARLLLAPDIGRPALNLLAHILRELAQVVTSRGILAYNIESISLSLAAVALFPTTSHGLGVLPHDLGEVAGVHGETGLVPVVLRSLGSPHVDEVAPASESGAACEVLTSTLFVFVSILNTCVRGRGQRGG